MDHSGALPLLMHRIPDKPVYCTANGLKSLKGHYHKDWNFQVVKTGDKLSLGKKELIFIEAMMLHWPDSMMEYLTGDAILFSNDAFGQHIATEQGPCGSRERKRSRRHWRLERILRGKYNRLRTGIKKRVEAVSRSTLFLQMQDHFTLI